MVVARSKAEHRKTAHDIEQLKRAIDRIRPEAMEKASRELKDAQINDAKELLALLEEAESNSKRMEARYQSAQLQFQAKDTVRGQANISVGGGVPRLIFAGAKARAIAAYAQRVAELDEQVKQGVA